jgi:S-formylglutathione hydrolase FrmB
MKYLHHLVIPVLLLLVSCQTAQITPGDAAPVEEKKSVSAKATLVKAPVTPGRWISNQQIETTVDGVSFSTTYSLYFPVSYTPGKERLTVLLLPDHGGTPSDWAGSWITRIANEQNWVLVAPNMKSSIYESEFFSDSRYQWAPVPGALWLTDVFIPQMRKHWDVFRSRETSAVVGAGNGARGAILITSRRPELFRYIGCLSGYFDNETMTRYMPLRNHYGEYKANKERWVNSDNAVRRAEALVDHVIFVSHGTDDYQYHIDQSLLLGIKINEVRKRSGKTKFRFVSQKGRVHDWNAFNTALPEMAAFFSE